MMKKSFWYNSDQNGDLLKPRTGHGQYVVDIDNMLFAITGLSNCTVCTYRVFLQCTMCTLFSVMPRYLLWPLYIQYISNTIRRRGDTGAYLGKMRRIQGHILGEITGLKFQNHKNVRKRVLSAHSNKLGQMGCQTKIQDMSELVQLRGKMYCTTYTLCSVNA